MFLFSQVNVNPFCRLIDIFHLFLGTGTRPSSPEIDGRSTVPSSQALQTQQTVTRFIGSTPVTASSAVTSVWETFSESSKMPRTVSTRTKTPKIPFASHLSSQSYSFQNPDVFAESSSEDVRQKTISRVQERYSSPSTLNVIGFTEFALLESSTKQAKNATTTQKEISTLPSRSRGVDVHQQKLSESSVKQKFSLSVSRVTQSTVTSAKLLSTSSKLLGFVSSAANITRTTVAIFPIIRPSPVSTEDWFTTTRNFKSPTHSIESVSSLVSGLAIPSDVVGVGTVSIYGSEETFSDKNPVQASSSKDEAFDGSSSFTSHSMELAMGTYKKSTVVNSSSPSAVDQTSILRSTKIRSSTPLISLDNPTVFPSRSLRDYKTEEIGTFSRNDPLTPNLALGAKINSLMKTSQQRSVQGSPTSFYESTVGRKLDSTMPLKKNSTFLLWKQTIDKSLDPIVTSSFGPRSFSELITGTSFFENATEAFSSLSLVSSAIDYFKTPEVISSTRSRTIGLSEKTNDLRSLVSSTLSTDMPLKRSPSRLKVPSSVSILQRSKLPSTPFVAQRKASLPSSSVIKSSSATEGGYSHFTTSTSQLPRLELKGETITNSVYSIEKLTSRPHVRSSQSTTKTSKLLLRTQATQITSSLSSFVSKHDYVYFTTSSYLLISSPLKREGLTRASSSQRTQSFTLIAQTSNLSITHLATDFKQLLSESNISKPAIDTEGGRLFLPSETSRSVASIVEEELITRPLHSLTSLTPRPIMPSSMSTSRTLKLPFTSIFGEINSSLSLSSSVKSSVVAQALYINVPTSSILKSSSEFQGDRRLLETSPPLSLISTFTTENTETQAFVDDLVTSSRQVLLSPSPQPSSPLQVEATPSLLAKTISSSKLEELSPPPLHVSLTRRVEPTISPMNSLSSLSLMQNMLVSVFSQSTSAQEIQPTQSHPYSLTSSMSLQRLQSLLSWRFTSALKREGTEILVGSGRSSPLTKCISSSMFPLFSSTLNVEATKSFLDASTSSTLLKFSPSQKMGAITSLPVSLRRLSSGQHTGNAVFPQLSSPLEEKVTTSPISSWASLPSRQHLMEVSTVISPLDSLQSSSSSQYILLSPSTRPSSALKEQSTTGYLESSASLLSRQQILSPVNSSATSALNVESTTGVVNFSRSSSSKHQIPSLPSLQVISAPKNEITRSFMDSLRPSPSKQEMASLSATEFSAASKIQITGSIMGPATTTSSKHDMPSLSAPQASLTPKEEPKTGVMSSFATSLSKLEISSSPSSQFSSTPNYEITKSLRDSVKTSLSKHEMQSLQPPKANSTSKVVDTIGFMNSSRTSSSKQEMQSLGSSHLSSTSKLEVTRTLTDSMRTSISKHEKQPLLPPKASATLKLEVTTSLTDSMRPSLLKHEMQSLLSLKASSTPKLEVTTSLLDSIIASSKHEMPLLPSPLLNSVPTVHVELSTTIMATLTTLSSMEKIPSLSSPQATSAPKAEFITSLLESFRTSLSKSSPSPLSSSAPKVEIKTSVMDLFSISSFKHRTPSLPPQQLSSGATTMILEDSITSSSSHHHPLPTTEFTTAIIGSLTVSLSKQEMPSLASPQAKSLPKVEITTSLMESFRTSLSKSSPSLLPSSTPKVELKTSVLDLFPTSSLKHETPSSSTLQLNSEVTTRIQEDPLTSASLHHHQMLEVASTKSLKVISTSSSSRQHVISSFSPHLSSLVKVEAPNRLLNSSRALSPRQRSLSSTFALKVGSSINVLDSLISSSPRQISPQPSSAVKEEASTTLMHSVTSSPSGHYIVLSMSPRLSSTLKVEAMTTSVESLTSSLSRQHILASSPQLSPPLITDAATANMDSSRKKILSSRSSQLNPSIEAEYTSGLKDSLRRLSSRQPILSSTAPQFSSVLKVDATTSHMESLSTGLLSRSDKKDKLSPSLVGSFTSSLTEQYIVLSVSTVQTSKLPTKPSASKVNSLPIPSIFTSSIFNKEDYTFFTTPTSSLLSSTPTMESSQRFLISSSSLYTSVLQERSTADQSVSYERHFTNSLKEGDYSLTLVSREERHQTVTAIMDAPSIPSSALKTQVSIMVPSSSEPASVKVAAAPTPTAVQEEKCKSFSEC